MRVRGNMGMLPNRSLLWAQRHRTLARQFWLTIRPRTAGFSMSGVLRGAGQRLRRGSCLVALALAGTGLCIAAARAQNATWLANPGSNDFNTGTNWTPATVPTATASFGTSTVTNLSFSTDTTIGGWTFNAGAFNYTFTGANNQVLTFTGGGIVINGGGASIANNSDLEFKNGSTAGAATITNNFDLLFYNNSTAGNATIINNANSGVDFNNTSTAGSATVNNSGFGGAITFETGSTAGSATINNNINGATIGFNPGSTAGNATVNNYFGQLYFASASAGNATINNNSVAMEFSGTGTAGSAKITNNINADITFDNSSTAGNATITNNGNLYFNDNSSAGSATITTSSGGTMAFSSGSTAGSATITSSSLGFTFVNNASAGSANITVNGGRLEFSDTSTAGSATITMNGGTTPFAGTAFMDGQASGGLARFILNGTGALDMSGLTTGGTTVGSIEGDGAIHLGANNLTVGGNGLSTTFSGVIQDGGISGGTGGSLTKVGAGTLTLSGINTYTGGTTVNGGFINFNSASSFGSGNITLNGGGLQWAAGNTTDISGKLDAIGAGGATFDYNGNAVTLATSLTGAGGVTVTNSGSGGALTFTAANTYMGGTTVAGGTLRLLGASTLGASTGATTIKGGGALDLGGTTQTQAAVNLAGGTIENGNLNAPLTSTGGTINGIGGTASLAATAGTTIVDGTNTYSGGTTVTNSTLVVNGSLSDPTIGAGGVLTGTGTVGATQINAGGTFAPGSGTPGTSMTVAGNLAFASSALYLVSLNPMTSSFANVTGTASLAGTVQANFTSGSYITKQKQYTILTAAGGLGGTTFGGLTNVNLPSGASDSLSYDASHVYLNLSVPFTSYTGLNQNQQNVANALTNYFNTTGGILAQFFGLAPGALTQIDGESATGAERAAFQLTNEFLALMLDPFVNGRGNVGGAGGPVLGFAPAQQTSLPPDIALAYASILAKAPPQSFEQRWTAWGSAFGGANRTNGDPAVGSNTTTASTYGFAGGMDYHFTPSTVAGFALAGAGTNWGLANALGTGRSDALQAGAYGISWFGPAYVAGALSFSNHWFTTGRSALGHQLTANFIGQSYAARLEGGYRVAALPTFAVTPYGAVQFQDFNTPAYSETDVTGGGFGLNYNAMNATDVRTELGSRFDAPTLVYGKPLVLYGRVAWAHDFVGNPALGAVFQSLPGAAFTVNGAPIPHDSALTTAGAQLYLTPQWTVVAKFDGEFANGSQTYGGSGTLRYAW
jgi:autotransporter-associated beta strand protein